MYIDQEQSIDVLSYVFIEILAISQCRRERNDVHSLRLLSRFHSLFESEN